MLSQAGGCRAPCGACLLAFSDSVCNGQLQFLRHPLVHPRSNLLSTRFPNSVYFNLEKYLDVRIFHELVRRVKTPVVWLKHESKSQFWL